jgi:hypothetical protein
MKPTLLHRRTLLLSATAAALLAAGCAQVSHVAKGDVVVRDRLIVTVDQPWNQFERGLGDNTPTWTQDGITVDALRFYVALKDGDLLAPTPSEPKGSKPIAFKSGMSAREVVGLVEQLYSRDGSSFTLTGVSPAAFAGQAQGFRFEFSSVRKADEVQLSGIGWGAVVGGQLTMITYTAPRLAFFPRHRKTAEGVATSARLKS